MALNLKNPAVERLAAEVSRLTGETKTEAIRVALEERRRRLTVVAPSERRTRLLKHLRERVWPSIPRAERGRRLSRDEEDAILGYGREGV
jgi:antitoxin VapB